MESFIYSFLSALNSTSFSPVLLGHLKFWDLSHLFLVNDFAFTFIFNMQDAIARLLFWKILKATLRNKIILGLDLSYIYLTKIPHLYFEIQILL